MSRYDLVVTSRRIVLPTAVLSGWLGVRDGRIATLGAEGAPFEAARVLDAGDDLVLPGIVDTHVHIRFPGHPERETWETGSDAAAAGGVTTLIEMPISVPPVHTGEILRRRMEAVSGRSRVDYAFYGGGGFEAMDQYGSMAEAGAVAFKIFMHRPQAGREHEFTGLYTTDDGLLLESLRRLAALGIPVCFHAETDAILEAERARLDALGRKDPLAHKDAHPVIAETTAIARVILLCAETRAKAAICHLSSAAGLRLLSLAKKAGVDIHVETCPHYLLFTEEDLARLGPDAKINPPLRTRDDALALWEGLRDGTVDYIGSDHAPFAAEEKRRGEDDIHLAPSGVPGIEMTLPILARGVDEGRIDWMDVARLISGGAARFFGLPGKGALLPGKDADLIVVEDRTPTTVRASGLRTMSRGTAGLFDGFRSPVSLRLTILRGEIVYEKGRTTGACRGCLLPGRLTDACPSLAET